MICRQQAIDAYILTSVKKKKDTWPGVGDQAERNSMLQVVLDELVVYEIMLERLLDECGGSPTDPDDIKSERELKSHIKVRENMIRTLALKNTSHVN